jgi:hypothetical protein
VRVGREDERPVVVERSNANDREAPQHGRIRAAIGRAYLDKREALSDKSFGSILRELLLERRRDFDRPRRPNRDRTNRALVRSYAL